MNASNHFEECDPPPSANGGGQIQALIDYANHIRKRLLNATQAASYLGIGKRSLWTLTNCGEIACVRIGRRVLYDVADLDKFIASHRKGGPRV